MIEKDGKGKLLFFVDCDNLFCLIENGNGNICVVDYSGKVVVVLNFFGVLWFKYNGNIMIVLKCRLFELLMIVIDEIF